MKSAALSISLALYMIRHLLSLCSLKKLVRAIIWFRLDFFVTKWHFCCKSQDFNMQLFAVGQFEQSGLQSHGLVFLLRFAYFWSLLKSVCVKLKRRLCVFICSLAGVILRNWAWVKGTSRMQCTRGALSLHAPLLPGRFQEKGFLSIRPLTVQWHCNYTVTFSGWCGLTNNKLNIPSIGES